MIKNKSKIVNYSRLCPAFNICVSICLFVERPLNIAIIAILAITKPKKPASTNTLFDRLLFVFGRAYRSPQELSAAMCPASDGRQQSER